MGKMAIRLKRLFDRALQEKVISLEAIASAKRSAEAEGQALPTIEKLMGDGLDPLHAVYAHTLNLIGLIGEQLIALPPLHPVHDFIEKWEDIYVPDLPPMSPVTKSHFMCWTMLDAAFGEDRETFIHCFLSLADRLPLNPIQVEVAKRLNESRMGIYEVTGVDGKYFQLRELVTNKEFTGLIPSGYQGRSGDLIMVRLVPPLTNTAAYHVGLTTPYQLVSQSERDWLQYFKRHDIIPGTVGLEARLQRHMKHGRCRTYWSEFIFYGYVNYGPGVIYLTGFPDQPETQPQHEKFRGRRTGARAGEPDSFLM